MTALLGYSKTWQTWDAKGFLVQNYKDPAPADDNQGNKWYDVNYDDSQWDNISGPVESFSQYGALYIRRAIILDDNYNGFDFEMVVESDDKSSYYFNGVFIGDANCGEGKKFSIPDSIIHSGQNLISAVVYDYGGEQFIRIDFGPRFTVTIDDFEYQLEDGVVSVSTKEGVAYADDARFKSQITVNGTTFDVTRIKNMSTLRNVYIPESINEISGEGRWGALDTYYDTDKSVTVSEDNPYFTMIDSVLYNKDITDLIWCANQKYVTVPEGVERILPYSFWGCNKLESVVLPSTTKGALHRVFDACHNLKTINIPAGVTELQYLCFASCPNLRSIYLNTSMPYDAEGQGIFGWVGYDCHVPDSCTLYVPVGSADLYRDFSVWSDFYNIVEDPSLTQTDISNIHNGYIYELENGVAKVSDLNLNYDDSRHYIMDNVTIDGQSYPVYTLKKITHKEEFKIPSFITSFDYGRTGTFDVYNSKIRSVKVDENNQSFIERDGLVYTKDHTELIWSASMQEIIVPEGVKHIAGSAFAFMHELEHITLPSTLEGELYASFHDCDQLQEIIIPEGVTILGDYFCNGCSSLKKVTLPQSLKQILYQAFNNCKELESIAIPANVNYIREHSFYGCFKLKEIICMVPDPSQIRIEADGNKTLFNDIDKETAVLYVPNGSMALYQNIPTWNAIKNIVEYPFTTNDFRLGKINNSILPIYLGNNAPVASFQFDLVLPEGFSIAKKQGTDEYDITMGTERFNGLNHTLVSRLQNDGSIRVVCSSSTNTNINDYDENSNDIRSTQPVLYIKLDIEANPGTHCFMFYDVVLASYSNGTVQKDTFDKSFLTVFVSDVARINVQPNNDLFGAILISGNEYDQNLGVAAIGSQVSLTANANEGYGFVSWTENSTDISTANPYSFIVQDNASITALFTLLGDVYEDGVVDVADLVSVIAIILEQQCSHRDSVAANVYSDNDIDVADYSSIVNIILNSGPYGLRAPARNTAGSNTSQQLKLYIRPNSITMTDGLIKIPLSMSNTDCQVVSLQFDIMLEETNSIDFSAILNDEIFKAERASNHTISKAKISDNVLRVVLTSDLNNVINGIDGELLSFYFNPSFVTSGSIDGAIKNLVFFTTDNVKYSQSDLIFHLSTDGTTKVDSATYSESNGSYYDLNGIPHGEMQKGFNIINGKVIYNR